jgi:hypothetical protein
MTNADFVAELHRAFDWRFDEVRSLKNVIESQPLAAREDLRKSLVLVLYAHFEGFCVFALQHYLAALNQIKLPCRSMTAAVVAGSWERLFIAMEHGTQKCEIFRQTLPDDAGLHRHWRRRHFVEDIDRLLDLPVQIDEDVIDAESNLKPAVLERNLFILGLDHTFVAPHAVTIHNLLGRRNRLGHGEDRRGVPEKDYIEYENAVFEICYRLIDFLDDAYGNSRYERSNPHYHV